MSFPGYRNAKFPLPSEIQYEGGSEGYVMIACRGWRFRFPGHVPILEVVLCLNGQEPGE